MRKAQGGLPFGASLIIAIVLSLIGAAFIFNMGGQIFGVVKSVPTEGSEIVAIANPGTLAILGIGAGNEISQAIAADPHGDKLPDLTSAWSQYREVEIGDFDGDGANEIILLRNSATSVIGASNVYKGAIVNVFSVSDYLSASKDTDFENIYSISGSPLFDTMYLSVYFRTYEIVSFLNVNMYMGDGQDAWALSKNTMELVDFDGDGKDEILILSKEKIFVMEEYESGDHDFTCSDYNGNLWSCFLIPGCESIFQPGADCSISHDPYIFYYSMDQDPAYYHNGGLTDYDLFLVENTNKVGAYEAIHIFRNHDLTQTDVKVGVTQLSYNEEDGTYESVKTQNAAIWTIPQNIWYQDAAICDFDHDGWDDELVLLRGDSRLSTYSYNIEVHNIVTNQDGTIEVTETPVHNIKNFPYVAHWEEMVCDDLDGDGNDEIAILTYDQSSPRQRNIYTFETEDILSIGEQSENYRAGEVSDISDYSHQDIRNNLPWGNSQIENRNWSSIASGNLIGN